MKKNQSYAGFWVRLIADLMDSTLLDFITFSIVCVILGFMYAGRRLFPGIEPGQAIPFFDLIDPFLLQIVLILIRGILSLAYYPYATFHYGTTMGKKYFRIYVESVTGKLTMQQSIIRCVAYMASYLPLGAGFLMIVFHPEKRGLHDLIAGTVSVIRPKKSSS